MGRPRNPDRPRNAKAENLLMRTPLDVLAAIDAEAEQVRRETGFELSRQKVILRILRRHYGMEGG